MKKSTPILAGLLPLLMATPGLAATINVAAAISTQDALNEIIASFEKSTGHQVKATYGASGKFFTQLTQGAPFDVYFSADNEYPGKLYQKGLCETPRRYGQGRLVLWTLKNSPLDPQKGLTILKDARIHKVAIANPEAAPYGRAAVEVMRSTKIYQDLESKLVRGANIAQTAQFADSGAAEIGFLSLSLAVSPNLTPHGKYWMIPARLHSPIAQDAAVIKASPEIKTARQFLDYCTSPKARGIWKRFGLEGD